MRTAEIATAAVQAKSTIDDSVIRAKVKLFCNIFRTFYYRSPPLGTIMMERINLRVRFGLQCLTRSCAATTVGQRVYERSRG